MATNSISDSADVSTSRRICDVVCRSLKTALAVRCNQRHGVDLVLECDEQASTGQPVHIRIEAQNPLQMTAGEVEDVRHMLPSSVRVLWPEG